MKVIVTGSRGFLGSALVAKLRAGGHQVTRLVRSAKQASPDDVLWDPVAGSIATAPLEAHDAAVNLAGAGIGDHRWSPQHKAAVLESRVKSTDLLARTLASLDRPPGVLASASAVGFYGHRGDEELNETSSPGSGFLSEVVQQWEAATAPAGNAGIRVATFRSGIVLSPNGGALKKQVTPFKLGLGGKLGSGKQWVSWISLEDEIAAIEHILTTPSLSGPVNLTAPNPVRNGEFTQVLGQVLHRPAIAPIPMVALNALFGREMVGDMMLASQRVLPAALLGSGFVFRHPDLEPALRHLLGPAAAA